MHESGVYHVILASRGEMVNDPDNISFMKSIVRFCEPDAVFSGILC